MCITTCPRQHDPTRTRVVHYRLCVASLIQKPGAFARLVYRDDLHPSLTFARTWERLRERLGEYVACRTYVRLLYLAHQHACEAALGVVLERMLQDDVLPDAEELRRVFATPAPAAVPSLDFRTADPAGYDALRCLPLTLPPRIATS